MKRILLSIAVFGLATLIASEAFAAGRGCRRGWVARPAAPVATAQAEGGYRAYSYEPGAAAAPARAYRAPPRTVREPYLDATSKALGKGY